MIRCVRPRTCEDGAAGQRVPIIEPGKDMDGYPGLGTGILPAADKSAVALPGASPGASTSAFIATEVLHARFADKRAEDGRLPALRHLFPTWGIDLKVDADACRRTRAETARALRLENV